VRPACAGKPKIPTVLGMRFLQPGVVQYRNVRTYTIIPDGRSTASSGALVLVLEADYAIGP